MKSGGEGKQTVFLFSDNQIKEESFVEDINMILNTADIPNLFASDEKAEIIEKMQTASRNEVKLYETFNLIKEINLILKFKLGKKNRINHHGHV
jgi:hypothetical protein